MFDKEGNLIILSELPNPNVLVWGRSGQGKTYFFCREIEKAVKKNQRVLILDYSGSYTDEELMKNKLVMAGVKIFNPAKHPYFWMPYSESDAEFAANLADSLITILNITSYFQKKWIRRTVAVHVSKERQFCIPSFLKTLEVEYKKMMREEVVKDDLENIGRLLSRLEPYGTLDKFYIKPRTEDKRAVPITIIQLSDLPELEKRFSAKLLIELFWKEVKMRKNSQNVLILDEIQYLLENENGAFSGVMREGRKFGLKAYMGTQFISSYKKEIVESLMQAGNIFIFKPTAKDLKFSAQVVDFEHEKSWKKLLNELDIGEVVLKGNYFINQGKNRVSDAIICRI